MTPAEFALRGVNQIDAMLAYWDADLRCRFANDAYREWFGRTPEEMIGMPMTELLGPLYVKNLPFIQGALAGRRQVFERRIPLPGGGVRDSVATYTPEIVDGVVRGFWAHVADVTAVREREAQLDGAVQAVIGILERSKDSFRSRELGALRRHLQHISESLREQRHRHDGAADNRAGAIQPEQSAGPLEKSH